ncbi:hypothetical protein FB45DRAFT_906408 [Roridomyces roridus]|uniref:Uncharacterized protein n=1 Tax=Roridomyces roridus TaxID=1738132 RepID=A0AAD7C2S1_9AGAR|nr:hypothetical protein FB45DRAFT_906408 [Roridomyces roridus]
MPAFTKTVSSLTKPMLIAAANAFQLDATGTATEIRARVKSYMEDHKAEIMASPDHAPLFSRKEREDWANREPTPSSWNGIPGSVAGSVHGSMQGDEDRISTFSGSFLRVTPGPGVPAPNPTANGFTEHELRIRHLQNLDPATLERVFDTVYAPGVCSYHLCLPRKATTLPTVRSFPCHSSSINRGGNSHSVRAFSTHDIWASNFITYLYL